MAKKPAKPAARRAHPPKPVKILTLPANAPAKPVPASLIHPLLPALNHIAAQLERLTDLLSQSDDAPVAVAVDPLS